MALYIALAVAVVIGLGVVAHLVIQKVIVPMALMGMGRPMPPPSSKGWIVLRRRGAPRR